MLVLVAFQDRGIVHLCSPPRVKLFEIAVRGQLSYPPPCPVTCKRFKMAAFRWSYVSVSLSPRESYTAQERPFRRVGRRSSFFWSFWHAKIGLAGPILAENFAKIGPPGPLLLPKSVRPDQFWQPKLVPLANFGPPL